MYLTYDRYLEFGGSIVEEDYTFFELLARKKLNYWTSGRIIDVTEDIELCMF